MGLFDKAKAAAEQAATKAREGVEDVQAKRELSQAYHDLGEAAFGLIEAGEVSHPRLEEPAGRVRALSERLAPPQEPTVTDGGATAGESSQPPAMPT